MIDDNMIQSVFEQYGFKSIDELYRNFVDKGDFIELVKPIEGITMIQKDVSVPLDWDSAENYAKELRIGGFCDWQLPLLSELKVIHGIVGFIHSLQTNHSFWSLSRIVKQYFTEFHMYQVYYILALDFANGETERINYYSTEESTEEWYYPVNDFKETNYDSGKKSVRCVRITYEKLERRIEDIEPKWMP